MGLSHVPLEPSHFTGKLLSVRSSWCRTDLSPAPLPPAGRISNTDEAWTIGSSQGLKRSKWKNTAVVLSMGASNRSFRSASKHALVPLRGFLWRGDGWRVVCRWLLLTRKTVYSDWPRDPEETKMGIESKKSSWVFKKVTLTRATFHQFIHFIFVI